MKSLIKTIFVFFVGLQMQTFGQNAKREIVNESKTFLAYLNQARITKHFGVWFDIHHRTTDNFVNRPLQDVGRLGVIFIARENLRITAGYCIAYNYPSAGLNTSKLEHRPWQQISLRQEYNGIQTSQVLRLEQRYLQIVNNDVATDEFVYSNRLRYSYRVVVPFSKFGIKSKSFSIVLNEEILIHYARNGGLNVFDQNRIFAGFVVKMDDRNSIHFGYMNIFQQLSGVNKFNNSHCIRIYYYHNLDFRKV